MLTDLLTTVLDHPGRTRKETPGEQGKSASYRRPTRRQRATRLLTAYQQRAVELARLRRAAIEEAHRERGPSYTDIAEAFGITKGRITQIRYSATQVERAFFGANQHRRALPVPVTDRERPLIAAEDAQTGEQPTRPCPTSGSPTGQPSATPATRTSRTSRPAARPSQSGY